MGDPPAKEARRPGVGPAWGRVRPDSFPAVPPEEQSCVKRSTASRTASCTGHAWLPPHSQAPRCHNAAVHTPHASSCWFMPMATHHGASDRLPMRAAASSGTRFSSLSASSPSGPPTRGLYVSPCHPISRSSAVFSNPVKRDIPIFVLDFQCMATSEHSLLPHQK